MKKILIALMITAGVAVAAFAHPPRGQHLNAVLEELQLDDTRAEDVRSIMHATHEQHREIMKKAKEERKTLRKATHEKLATILTEEELKTFKQTMRNEKQYRKAGNRCPHGPGKNAIFEPSEAI